MPEPKKCQTNSKGDTKPGEPDVSLERLHEVLDYDPITGSFMWLVARGNRARGSIACRRISRQGYFRIRVDGKLYQAHRLAWFYTHGYWPPDDVDHINQIKTDNRLTNLRLATRSENNQNRKGDPLGVRFEGRRWQARISLLGETIYLGSFLTFEEARYSYLEARRELHPRAPANEEDPAWPSR